MRPRRDRTGRAPFARARRAAMLGAGLLLAWGAARVVRAGTESAGTESAGTPPGPSTGAPEAASPTTETPKAPQVRSRKGFAIRITNPLRDDFRFGRSEIDAEVAAADPTLVEKVEFHVDDRLVFIDTEPPYQCFFDFGTEPRSWEIGRASCRERV